MSMHQLLAQVARKKVGGTLQSFQTAAAGDDGQVNIEDASISTLANPRVASDSGDDDFEGFVRFPSITVANGVTVSAATLKLYLNSKTGSSVAVIVNYDNTDNATAPTGYSDHNAKSWTGSASKTVTESAGQYIEWDVTSYVQAIVNRSGWASGQAMQFRVHSNSSSSYSYYFRDYEDSSNLPTLEITS